MIIEINTEEETIIVYKATMKELLKIADEYIDYTIESYADDRYNPYKPWTYPNTPSYNPPIITTGTYNLSTVTNDK